MTMKTHKALVFLVLALGIVALAGTVAAATATVPAGGSTPISLGTLNEDDMLSLDWTSNVAVSGTLTGPSGVVETFSASSFGVYPIITIPETGSYTLTFNNAGATPATVNYNTSVSPFSPEGFFDDIVTTLLIIGIVIVVIIVVIVVLVVYVGGRKKQPAMAGAPAGVVTPTTPGMCPVCGAQTDTNAQFCQKCGAKFR